MRTLTVKDKLDAIHKEVYSRFTYTPDIKQWGEVERWLTKREAEAAILSEGTIKGDCDDFALVCRHLCRKQDIPSRLVVCKTEENEYHIVLEVDGWILDNRHRKVKARDDLPYEWIAVSGYEAGETWKYINN